MKSHLLLPILNGLLILSFARGKQWVRTLEVARNLVSVFYEFANLKFLLNSSMDKLFGESLFAAVELVSNKNIQTNKKKSLWILNYLATKSKNERTTSVEKRTENVFPKRGPIFNKLIV